MLEEFEKEQKSGNPYTSSRLSNIGKEVFPSFMKETILNGDEEGLFDKLNNSNYWKSSGTMLFDAKRLAFTEFNTWYVRGLAKKLINESIKECQVYRLTPKIMDEQKNECEECNKIENTVISVNV